MIRWTHHKSRKLAHEIYTDVKFVVNFVEKNGWYPYPHVDWPDSTVDAALYYIEYGTLEGYDD